MIVFRRNLGLLVASNKCDVYGGAYDSYLALESYVDKERGAADAII